MDPSNAQHRQEMGSQTLESMLVCTKTQQEKKPRPQPEQALKCPRCDSTNTKFCYYNNYSLSQPRYFCKSCRRYWTKGGTLRNVPVGGGCRKNKRSSSSSKRSQDQPLTANATAPLLSSLPNLAYDSNDLSLAFSRLHRQPTGQLGFDHDHHDQLSMLGNTTNTTTQCDILGNPRVNSSGAIPGFLDALRSEYLETAANGFHNLYYGIASGNMGGPVENCGMGMNVSETMAAAGTVYEDHTSVPTTPAVTVTAMKQEYCNNAREDDQHRVFWGLPWHLGGDGGGNMGDLDSGRETWNGLSSSWHGLLNSPLV